MEVSFYLKNPKAEKETIVYSRICYNGYQLKYYLSEKINPIFWNKNTQRAIKTPKFPSSPEFNRRLVLTDSKIKEIFYKYQNDNENLIPSEETFKELLNKEFKKVEAKIDPTKTFFGFYEKVIELTETGGRVVQKTGKAYSKGTIQIYKNTYNRLKEFQVFKKIKIDFDTIDQRFYYDFVAFMNNQEHSINTIGKDIKTLKTILEEATQAGVNKNLTYKNSKFKVLTEESDSIYLKESELNEIESYDLKDASLERVRDMFIIGCYTGLRFSDFSILNSNSIKDGFIEIITVKGNQSIAIPIHSKVKKILEKYNGELPKAISNQKFNEKLKEIGVQIPCLIESFSKEITKGGNTVSNDFAKWELLTTHTARRSFATNEYLAGTPAITIMAITGHKTEKMFMKYLKLIPKEHAVLLEKRWKNRENNILE